MPSDPQTLGYRWPEPTTLHNPAGNTLTIRPAGVRPKTVTPEISRREGELYRDYATDRGVMTELEVKRWFAGGFDECRRFVHNFEIIMRQAPNGMALTLLIDELQRAGLHDQTIEINFGWLLIDAYISATIAETETTIKIERW